jgi:hypothetical protein
MVLVAVTAVLLAACASLRSRALLRLRAIEAVDRLHGGYGIWISGPDWYRRLLARTGVGEKAFYDPIRISLGPNCTGYDPGHPVRDADLEQLAEYLVLFPNLEILDLRDCRQVTDRGVVALPYLTKLKDIQLEGTAVTEKGLETLRRRYPDAEISR